MEKNISKIKVDDKNDFVDRDKIYDCQQLEELFMF